MTVRAIDRRLVEGLDLQALAVLSLSPEQFSARLGVVFDTVDDDLDSAQVAALEGDGVRFLLMRGINEPGEGTNLLTPDEGDPTELTRRFVDASELTSAEVTLRWTGRDWVESPLSTVG